MYLSNCLQQKYTYINIDNSGGTLYINYIILYYKKKVKPVLKTNDAISRLQLV